MNLGMSIGWIDDDGTIRLGFVVDVGVGDPLGAIAVIIPDEDVASIVMKYNVAYEGTRTVPGTWFQ